MTKEKVLRFRKKPIVVEAVQWTGINGNDLDYFFIEITKKFGIVHSPYISEDGSLMIPTLEGDMKANINDWIICGVKGEIYPCKPDIFDQTYEKYQDNKFLSDYKLGDIIDDKSFTNDPIMRILKSPVELVAVGYTLQDKNGTQATITLKNKDFIEDENESDDNDDEDE